MKTAIVKLKSISPYSQSAYLTTPKQEKESADEYEKRCWRDRCHVTADGHIFIPPMALKKSLDEAASFSPRKIAGRGKATYSKHFKSGVLVTDGIVLPLKKDDVVGEWGFYHAQPGLGDKSPRVRKCYPVIQQWEGTATFHILDETLTEDVFTETLREAGNFVGIGRFRPRNGGYFGRFTVESVQWK